MVVSIVITETLVEVGTEFPHPLTALTDINPLEFPAVVTMKVPLEFPVHPEGSVQLYDDAPGTGVMEKVFILSLQIRVSPEMIPGCEGIGEVVIVSEVIAVESQAFFA